MKCMHMISTDRDHSQGRGLEVNGRLELFRKFIRLGGSFLLLIEAITKICPDLLWMNEAQIRGGLSNPGPGTTRASQTRMTSVTRFFRRRVTQVTQVTRPQEPPIIFFHGSTQLHCRDLTNLKVKLDYESFWWVNKDQMLFLPWNISCRLSFQSQPLVLHFAATP